VENGKQVRDDGPQPCRQIGGLGRSRRSAAVHMCKELVNDCEHAFGADHPDTLAARRELAMSYQRAGRTLTAIMVLEELVNDYEELLGSKPGDALIARSNLGVLYGAVGRITEADRVLDKLVNDYGQALGADHPDTIIARSNLAAVRQRAGREDDGGPARLTDAHEVPDDSPSEAGTTIPSSEERLADGL
jgi:tetratricopeptide (TPR) repeat protein